MDASENKRSIAVVTGASGGFGKEFVRLLLEEDTVDEIWAVARNKEKLQKLSDEFGSRICVIPMDLTNPVERRAFAEKLEQEKVKIQFLVNNAGYAKFCAYDELGVEESLNMLELNCNAVVAMGLFCIPYMEQGSHIVSIASLAAFLPLPYLNLYSASKAFCAQLFAGTQCRIKAKRHHSDGGLSGLDAYGAVRARGYRGGSYDPYLSRNGRSGKNGRAGVS